MADRLIRTDFKRKKMIMLRTTVDENGNTVEKEIEMDLPMPPTVKGEIRKLKRDENGRFYETVEVVETPVFPWDRKEN